MKYITGLDFPKRSELGLFQATFYHTHIVPGLWGPCSFKGDPGLTTRISDDRTNRGVTGRVTALFRRRLSQRSGESRSIRCSKPGRPFWVGAKASAPAAGSHELGRGIQMEAPNTARTPAAITIMAAAGAGSWRSPSAAARPPGPPRRRGCG